MEFRLTNIALFAAIICSSSLVVADQPPQHSEKKLMESHRTLTMHRLMHLGLACHNYAHENGRFPSKPSELRSIIGDDWKLFFATYDYIKTFDAPKDKDQLWPWIDENTSFKIHGERFDPDALPEIADGYDPEIHALITERKPLQADRITTVAFDGATVSTKR